MENQSCRLEFGTLSLICFPFATVDTGDSNDLFVIQANRKMRAFSAFLSLSAILFALVAGGVDDEEEKLPTKCHGKVLSWQLCSSFYSCFSTPRICVKENSISVGVAVGISSTLWG